VRTQITAKDSAFLAGLKIFALCAPHLEIGGAGNNGYITIANGQRILMAQKGGKWLAMGATVPFSHLSCGYVGASDGWTDLHEDFKMDWEFERASDGNIALTGQLDRSSRSALHSETASIGRSPIYCNRSQFPLTSSCPDTAKSGLRLPRT
jgi:glucoamylase